MGNGKKPKSSSCIAIKYQIFKILPSLLYGYHTPQLKNIAISPIAFSVHNFKLLPFCQLAFLWVSNSTYFFGDRQKLCVNYNYTVISNITVLVSNNVICFGYFRPISYCVNKKTPPIYCVHWDLNPHLKNITPSFFPNPLSNLQTVQDPLFR